MVLTEATAALPYSYAIRTLVMIVGLAWCGLPFSYGLSKLINMIFGPSRIGLRRILLLVLIPLTFGAILTFVLATFFPITLPWGNYEKNLLPLYEVDIISPFTTYLLLAVLYLTYFLSGRLNGFFGLKARKRGKRRVTLKQFTKSQFFLLGLGFLIGFLLLKLFVLRGAYGNFLGFLGLMSGISLIHFGSEKSE